MLNNNFRLFWPAHLQAAFTAILLFYAGHNAPFLASFHN
jgi:hypothetical protein